MTGSTCDPAYYVYQRPKVKDLKVCAQVTLLHSTPVSTGCILSVCTPDNWHYGIWSHVFWLISVLAHKVLLRVIVCASELTSIQPHCSRTGLFCTLFTSTVLIWSNLSLESDFHKCSPNRMDQ